MKIVLASVLKPVTDPRLLARLGRSLATLPGAEVHIVAHRAVDAPSFRVDDECHNVFLYPTFHFPRLSVARLLAGHQLTRHLRLTQPDLLVVGAAELLPAGVRWHRETSKPLVYDVRENYGLNVRTQRVFPPLVAPLLAAYIERLEATAAPHLAGTLLAERIYADQLPWLKNCRRVAVIENKYQPTSPIPALPLRPALTADRPLRFLISGTLSELYGTFDAIKLLSRPSLGDELHIVGYAPRPADAAELRRLAAFRPWLKLTGIEHPVSHAVIVDAIRHADVGLLPYRPHPSLDGCVPTKLREYQAEGLPIVQRVGDHWRTIYGSTSIESAGTVTASASGYTDTDSVTNGFLRAIDQLPFGQPPAAPPPEAFWAPEAERLLAFVRSLEGA